MDEIEDDIYDSLAYQIIFLFQNIFIEFAIFFIIAVDTMTYCS